MMDLRQNIIETHFPVDEFRAAQEARLLAGSRPRRNAMSNNASKIGHPCVRHIVYTRTHGDQCRPYSAQTLASFQEGNDQELKAYEIINNIPGFRLGAQQREFWVKDKDIHGFMDGIMEQVSPNGEILKRCAAEIKSIFNADQFERMNHYTDFLDKPYHRGWLAQLSMAVFDVANREGFDDEGALILKCRALKMVKVIPVPILYDLINECYAKADKANKHLKAGTLPERIPISDGLCKGCDFEHICQPAIALQGGKYIDEPPMLEKVRRMMELKPLAAEYKETDKTIKDIFRDMDGDEFMIGEWMVNKKTNKKGAITVVFTQWCDRDEFDRLYDQKKTYDEIIAAAGLVP